MKFLVQGLESFLIHVSVDLSGRNIRVAQHVLDHPEIRPVLQ